MTTHDSSKILFTNLTADDNETTEIESLCTECGENGSTRILLTKIPHYKEVVLMSFSCDFCGNSNNEITSGGMIQKKGIKFSLLVQSIRDLNRQIVKSDDASFTVPLIDLEIPPKSQKGAVTTLEGILTRTITGLKQDQTDRRKLDPENALKIEEYILRIEELLRVEKPFKIEMRDISGNSYIENTSAPLEDPFLTCSYFERSSDENHSLGIYTQRELYGDECENDKENDDLKDEVLTFPTNCPDCNSPCSTNMKLTSIPHFKEVIIMATVCESCGHKTNEVKSGGGIEAKGTKIILHITHSNDLSRDVLKSETCSISIPELQFETGGYSIGGKFTTLEGILSNIKDQVNNNPFLGCAFQANQGDSLEENTKERILEFQRKMDEYMTGSTPFTLVLNDPAGNSYLQNLYAPDEDPEMTIEHYERTFEQNEDLGLNDMKTEDYESEPRKVSPIPE